MGTSPQNGARRPQFTIRTALLTMAAVALAFAWYNSVIALRQKNEKYLAHLARAQSEILNARSRAEWAQEPKDKMSGRGGLSNICLDGVNLRNISIRASFQNASFQNSDLRGSTLIGDASSFQYARFDNANLAGATLSGAGASFQAASFADADLSGAVVTGNLQCATFEGAKLIGARIVVSSPVDFQSVNIDGAQFQGADLSTITPEALESCYFYRPPLYDKTTLFPNGFDPAAHGWSRAD